MVQDEDGSPIEGVKIIVNRPGSNSVLRENVDYLENMAYAVSDERGRWTVDFIWKELASVTLYLTHPDYARGEANVRLADANSERVLKLLRGIEVAGFVVDSEGQSIGDAKIDEETQTSAPELSTSSAANGYFVFPHVRPGKFRLIVEAAGCSKLDKVFSVSQTVNDLRLELQRLPVAGHGLLRGRVLDENGEAAPEVSVQLAWNQPGLEKTSWSTRTDDAGRFVWVSAPDGNANYSFYGLYYRPFENVSLASDGSEHEIRLNRQTPWHLRGTVVDAVTRQPIPRFTVLAGEAHEEFGNPDFRLLGEGSSGTFDLLHGDKRGRSLREMLQIEAEGYQPQLIKAPAKEASEPGGHKTVSARWEGDQDFRVELQPNRGLTGSVVHADGHAVVGAQVALSGNGLGVSMPQPGKFFESHSNERIRVTRTDSDGAFRFKPTLNVERVLVAHPDGWANLSASEANGSAIVLRMWGKVEGKLLIGSQPGANLQILLDPGEWGWRATASRFPFVYQTATDASGRFEFTCVPAGQCRVSRRHARPTEMGPVGFSNAVFIEVKPGETATVVIGGSGVTIFGKLAAAPSDKQVDWTLNIQRLVPATLPRKDFPASFQSFDFFCQPDGSFRVPDVPPGSYRLDLHAYGPPARPDDELGFGREIGHAERDVTVPESSESPTALVLDLGVINVQIRK